MAHVRSTLVCIRGPRETLDICCIFCFLFFEVQPQIQPDKPLTTLPNQAHWPRVGRVPPCRQLGLNPGPFWAPTMGYTSEPRPQVPNPVHKNPIFWTEINNKRSAKWSIYKRAVVQYYKIVVNLLNPTKKSCMLWSQYKTHFLPCLLHDLFISIGIYQIGKIFMNYQDNLSISWGIRRGWRGAS